MQLIAISKKIFLIEKLALFIFKLISIKFTWKNCCLAERKNKKYNRDWEISLLKSMEKEPFATWLILQVS
jgi:hypothetical protein